jgi:hypothetical protein
MDGWEKRVDDRELDGLLPVGLWGAATTKDAHTVTAARGTASPASCVGRGPQPTRVGDRLASVSKARGQGANGALACQRRVRKRKTAVLPDSESEAWRRRARGVNPSC